MTHRPDDAVVSHAWLTPLDATGRPLTGDDVTGESYLLLGPLTITFTAAHAPLSLDDAMTKIATEYGDALRRLGDLDPDPDANASACGLP